MELIDIVRKLVGPINPIGETNDDNNRFENLRVMTVLVDKLIADIDVVASKKDRCEYSIQRAGKYATKFMDDLGIVQ
jgi:hypothetical protein